jgi:hypothetical protein
MDETERRTAKRSRFDQTEPEPRRSRFDRRSRSPPAKKAELGRDRSPLNKDFNSPVPDVKRPSAVDAAAAAGKSIIFAFPLLLQPCRMRRLTYRFQLPLRPKSTLKYRQRKAFSMSMYHPSSRPRPSRPARTPLAQRRLPTSMVRCMSQTAIISRTSKSTICATDTSLPKDQLRRW